MTNHGTVMVEEVSGAKAEAEVQQSWKKNRDSWKDFQLLGSYLLNCLETFAVKNETKRPEEDRSNVSKFRRI